MSDPERTSADCERLAESTGDALVEYQRAVAHQMRTLAASVGAPPGGVLDSLSASLEREIELLREKVDQRKAARARAREANAGARATKRNEAG